MPGFDPITGKALHRKRSPPPVQRLGARQSKVFRKMTLLKDNKKMKAKVEGGNTEKKKEKRQMLKEINKKLVRHKEHSMERNDSTILAFTDSFEQLFQ